MALEDGLYGSFMAQQRERRALKEGLFTVTNSKANKKLTKQALLSSIEKEDPNILKKVSGVLRKVPSQNEFWNEVKIKVINMVDQYGPATFWMTFSPGEFEDESLHE